MRDLDRAARRQQIWVTAVTWSVFAAVVSGIAALVLWIGGVL